MSSSKYLPLRIVLCLQIVLLAAVCASERERYCGPKLTQMLQILCRNVYASPTYNNRNDKRSDDAEDNEYINDELLNYPPFAFRPYPFVRQFDSTSPLGTRVRRDYTAVKRGVYDECCRSPCSLKQLMSYCGA
ncbi:hypothetical protein HA402_015088 [Bradysia odoriphaga]|nr:hypothetical protein HA402_015088 [Bradysia odoriphaga]